MTPTSVLSAELFPDCDDRPVLAAAPLRPGFDRRDLSRYDDPSWDLGPAVFENLGFLPAVRSYVSQFSARTDIKVKLQEGHLPTDIPSSHQVALYRVLQGPRQPVVLPAQAIRPAERPAIWLVDRAAAARLKGSHHP